MDKIIVKGARENNLKNIDIELPKNKLIVMTGVSGSGKSSLAFDTIYAEGQRRYIESINTYARQFLGNIDKPDVDSIEGLSPSISIDQKTTSKNPRSTIGTVTEIYDHLRLLYSRIGIPHCINHNIPIISQSIEEMTEQILKHDEGAKLVVLSPLVKNGKGEHKDLISSLKKDGYSRIRVNKKIYDLSEDIEIDKNKKNNIEVVIDRLIIKEDVRSRLYEAIETATKLSKGKVIVDVIGEKEIVMSENFACPLCDFSLEELEPRIFSFNAPMGACDDCKGLGFKLQIDENLIVPDSNKSINEGAIEPLSNMDDINIYRQKLEIVCEKYNIELNKKFKDLTEKEKQIVLRGTDEIIEFKFSSRSGNIYNSKDKYEGIVNNLERRYMETNSEFIRDWIGKYMIQKTCETCQGKRLKKSVLSILINKKNIIDLTDMDISKLYDFFITLKLNKEQEEISRLLIKEIMVRLNFLINVGLGYLTLSRSAATLSGGEAQRIRLATQIGSKLTGVLYVLDEPSIGLHQRDNQKLINSLKEMRDLGNTLIVVEHDIETMLQADYLVDIGPGAGDHGGEVVAQGTPDEVMKNKVGITSEYLNGTMKIDTPDKRRSGNGEFIKVIGASENNLKSIDVEFPLGKFIVVTGVSGSGKSSLINEVLYKNLASSLYSYKEQVGKCKKIEGIEKIDKIVDISQTPIGRTPRSNPATYTGVFDDIRDVFAATKEAKIRGYSKGRFSFNVKGGRCEACYGDGVKRISMHFLPDVYVPCEVCNGTRYNKETLAIKYKDKNIAEVLDMRVEEAYKFFENIPKIKHKTKVLMDVGLGYVKLGQSAPTLSGGEASRVKLSKELQKKPTGKSLFILDEPTTGLHSDDIKKLLKILNKIVDNGDTVIVIEHNLDVIKVADYIIDLGKEGGDAGGEILFAGTPEDIVKCKNSYTGEYLKKYLEG
ncbi:MAG TPA: excinuclease ABC subunit UvrA [Bacilli bacterium]|nr:excinuclease ABC subunit UvrA [Bacilli bacterium]